MAVDPRVDAVLRPYLVWVTIAGVLNYEVVQLNGPFG
jgi:translocator protein